MNKLWIAALFVSTAVTAQVKEGKVIFERKINVHKGMPPEAEQFRAMVPEFNTSNLELLFNATQSIFHPVAKVEDELPQTDGGGFGGRRSFNMMAGGDAEIFKDYEKELIVESRELGPRKYIIEDTLKTLKWKLEEDTATILGFLCHKATTLQPAPIRNMRFGRNADTTSKAAAPAMVKVVAWYSEQIESQAGPDVFFGLPGLILKVDIDNGLTMYTALSIERLEKPTVKAPTSGKKISRDEYRKMMAQQMQGMGRPGGAGGGQRMIIQQ